MKHLALFEHIRGDIQVFTPPKEDEEYIIGADIALARQSWMGRAAITGDASTFVVLRRGEFSTLEQVAECRTRCEAMLFGEVLAAVGAHYNHAIINIERQLADAPFGGLRRAGYPLERLYQPPTPLGVAEQLAAVYFTPKTKQNSKYLLDTVIDYLRNGALVLRSKALVAELRSLQRDEQGHVVTHGKDLSVALMMGVVADTTTPPPMKRKEKEREIPAPPHGVDVELWNEMHGGKKKAAAIDDLPDWGGSEDLEWTEIGPAGAD